eukprot:scaffold5950_cov82-Isochrysis_galbana.AAC.1
MSAPVASAVAVAVGYHEDCLTLKLCAWVELSTRRRNAGSSDWSFCVAARRWALAFSTCDRVTCWNAWR